MIERILHKIGATVKASAIRKCPIDNGRLRASIQYRIEGNSVFVGTDVSYANYVEYGTGIFHIDEHGNLAPHTGWDIEPVNAQALRFEVGRKERLSAHKGPGSANIVITKKVHIEGMYPHPFLRPAVFENIPTIKEIIKNEILNDYAK